jgi:hypothetical protein
MITGRVHRGRFSKTDAWGRAARHPDHRKPDIAGTPRIDAGCPITEQSAIDFGRSEASPATPRGWRGEQPTIQMRE